MVEKQLRKRLKPSKREKKRYLVLKSDEFSLRQALRDIYFKAIGIGNGRIMIRIALKDLNKAKEALSLKGIRCIGISGTILRAKNKFWNRN